MLSINTEKVMLKRQNLPEDGDHYIYLNLEDFRKMMLGLPALLEMSTEGKSENEVTLVTMIKSLSGDYNFEEAIKADVTPSTIHLFHYAWRSFISFGENETFEEVLRYLPLSTSELEKLISAYEKFEQIYSDIAL
jgi:hypothetical protein